MKLVYKRDGKEYAIETGASFVDEVKTAVETLAKAFNMAETSVEYLLQNGWSQSLQDAYAGPRAKAIKDGEHGDTLDALIESWILKRKDNILSGEVSTGSGGRDQVRIVGRQMMLKWFEEKGITLPSDKDKINTLLDKYLSKNEAAVRDEVAKRKAAKVVKIEVDPDSIEF